MAQLKPFLAWWKILYSRLKEIIIGINYDTGSELVQGGHNALFNEVSWFYPQNSVDQIDRLVTYNYLEQVWTTGTLDRTSWANADIFDLPFATQLDESNPPDFPTINGVTNGRSILYEQETGTNPDPYLYYRYSDHGLFLPLLNQEILIWM